MARQFKERIGMGSWTLYDSSGNEYSCSGDRDVMPEDIIKKAVQNNMRDSDSLYFLEWSEWTAEKKWVTTRKIKITLNESYQIVKIEKLPV